ncbi:winged helix-turn-helix domain-containing protein [Deinococcus phoenicis]|uniref:winged helix-turn-helix domain-containing protein n=1 Tax=Deinococcus phoenicis TaxID=1476583 RepID=UPI0038994814
MLRPKSQRSTARSSSAWPATRPRALDLPFSLWTGWRLADYLAELTGTRLSAVSVYRLLHQGGIHFNRPQHTITSPDPEYTVKKKRSRKPATS